MPVTEEIKPALTAEAWRRKEVPHGKARVAVSPNGYIEVDLGTDAWACVEEDQYHALAALALYGQSFGFTREDVATMREAARYIRAAANGESDHYREMFRAGAHGDAYMEIAYGPSGFDTADAIEALVAKIAALLPPDEGEG